MITADFGYQMTDAGGGVCTNYGAAATQQLAAALKPAWGTTCSNVQRTTPKAAQSSSATCLMIPSIPERGYRPRQITSRLEPPDASRESTQTGACLQFHLYPILAERHVVDRPVTTGQLGHTFGSRDCVPLAEGHAAVRWWACIDTTDRMSEVHASVCGFFTSVCGFRQASLNTVYVATKRQPRPSEAKAGARKIRRASAGTRKLQPRRSTRSSQAQRQQQKRRCASQCSSFVSHPQQAPA